MRQAIITKYLGPTNFRGSRVKATAQAGSITLSWDDALGVDENHLRAALALCKKFGWDNRSKKMMALPLLIGGGLPNNTGNVYVFRD